MTISPPEVSDVAKRSAITWLHVKSEREILMSRSIAEWPTQTYHLAMHIQEAIDTAKAEPHDAVKHKHWSPNLEEEARMRE